MSEVITIGLDIAKAVFHAHGADASGKQIFSRRLRRGKLLESIRQQPRCLIAMEACSGAHHWAREFVAIGHEVRLRSSRILATIAFLRMHAFVCGCWQHNSKS